MGLDKGGFEAIPACRAILRYVLFIREEPVFQDLTVLLESFLVSECKPYHLLWDLAGQTGPSEEFQLLRYVKGNPRPM